MSQSPPPEGRTWSEVFPRYWVKYLTPGQIGFLSHLTNRWPRQAPGQCQEATCTRLAVCSTWERLDEPGPPRWGGTYLCSPHGEERAAEHGVRPVPADPRYTAWSLTPEGRRPDEVCESRGCGKPATHVTYTQDSSRTRPLESELLRCTRHAEEYAARHHVEIRPLVERGPR